MPPQFGDILAAEPATKPTAQQLRIERTPLQQKRAQKHTKTKQVPVNTFFSMMYGGNSAAAQATATPNSFSLQSLPLSTATPTDLASQCISAQIEKDDSIGTLYETFSKYIIDNYNFEIKKPLGPFSRFEKSAFYNFPERLSEGDSVITNMNILAELERVWIACDDKLFLWNYTSQSSNDQLEMVDQFTGTILACELIKPKKAVFIDSVSHLLIVSTSKQIHILAVEFDSDTKKLVISDPQMMVSTHGLLVNKFATLNSTGDIFFTGSGTGDSIWKLNYSTSNDWFSKACSKECLTGSSISTVLPSIPIFNIFNEAIDSNSNETIIEMKVDQERFILYTLSSKSILRVYKINEKSLNLMVTKSVKRILDDLSKSSNGPVNTRSKLLNATTLKFIKMDIVTKQEDLNLYLVLVSSNGCRIYIKGVRSYDGRVSINASHVKFPPMDLKTAELVSQRKERLIKEGGENNLNSLHSSVLAPTKPVTTNTYATSVSSYGIIKPPSILNRSNTSTNDITNKSITKSQASPSIITLEELKNSQESSNLLENTKFSLIISPGIFIGFSTERGLYISTPDYGFLKKSSQYVEDFEMLEKFQDIYSIFQLTPSFNATNNPKGYINEFASQYTSKSLEFGVLTKEGIHIFRYRTPDLILDGSLDEKTFKKFGEKYGYDEACSTSLYLSCLFDRPESFRNLATKFFISGGQNGKINSNLPQILDNVEPSDRFYAVLLLVSRILRPIWEKEVFQLRDEIKFNASGYIDIETIKKLKENPSVILQGLNITKEELQYCLSSILIIIKFFEDNKKIIPGLTNNMISSSIWQKSQGNNKQNDDLSNQAEQICFNSITQFLSIIKEGLSFLTILLEENELSKEKYLTIVNYLTVQMQVDLSCLTFKDFFAKSGDETNKLIKELLSSIINISISRGESVELVANALQKKCGSFCSTGDVLIFKAIEKLKQAKKLHENEEKNQQFGINQQIRQYLKDATDLLKQTGDSLEDETIVGCLNIMLELEYFEIAISFILDLANTSEQVNFANEYSIENHTNMLLDSNKKSLYDKRMKLYSIIFKILTDLDKKAITSVEVASNNTLIGLQTKMIPHSKRDPISPLAPGIVNSRGEWLTHYTQMRDSCNEICLKYNDKMFHYEFYQWFIKNGISDKLLEIDTPFILNFLKMNFNKNLKLSQLLWVYYSKRGQFYESAKCLYELSLSKFDIQLIDRFKYLSISKNFINGIETQEIKNEVVELGIKIEDLIAVANLQDELINVTQSDSRLTEQSKRQVEKLLNKQILTMNELFNSYIDPFGYYELALIAFKVSNHRNRQDILSRWESLFGKWKFEFESNKSQGKYYIEICNKFTLMAQRVYDVDALLPIVDLLQLLLKAIYQGPQSGEIIPGVIVDSFTKAGVDYGKIYYNMKDLIEATTYEVFEGYSKALKSEMKYLIENWFKNDKKVRNAIAQQDIENLGEYSLQRDPIMAYIRRTGFPL